MNKDICRYIDDHKETFVELESLLSSIPAISPLSGGEGEYKKAHALGAWLQNQGYADLQYIEAPDEKAYKGVRTSLILTIPGKNTDRNFWIMSHIDIVPPGDLKLWETDPYKVVEKEGKLFGRGVEDNQHGIVTSVMAALALKNAGIQPQDTVKLLFVADEEIGSVYGLKYIIKEYPGLFGKEDYALVPDSGCSTGDEIEIAEKNMLWLRFRTKGVQCHASRPKLGRNAFVAGSALVLKLAELEDYFKDFQDNLFSPPCSTFAPTKKEANIPNVNTIPGEDIFYMDCRILPTADMDKIMGEINSRCAQVEKEYGVEITIEIFHKDVSKKSDPESHIIKHLKKVLKDVTGKEARLTGIGGGTVAAHLRNIGMNVAVWSTIDETCHMPNEYTWIKNLQNDAKVMAHLMI
ncbi:MAG: M20 family metallo-hydrolase [Spirochaetia bacterium]|nr:M20 family metallo-hydrolase [Spirochaetia bacterium]